MYKYIFILVTLLHICSSSHWETILAPGTDPKLFALEHDLKYLGRVLDKFDVFEADEKKSNMNFHLSPQVESFVKQVKRKHYSRSINDPLYPSQWHLPIVNATAAWNQGLYGEGVILAIVDDYWHLNYVSSTIW